MSRRDVHKRLAFSLVGLLWLAASGCSTVECIEGIPAVPAGRVPVEFLGRARSEMQEISMVRLRQDPPEVYKLGPRDILGIYIQTVLPPEGDPSEPVAPPVHFPEEGDRPPSIGFPIAVRENGTIDLPSIDPINVDGMTVEETTEAIRKAYTVDRKILPTGKDRIIVTLMRRRTFQVLVIREESGGVEGVTKRGTGAAIDLAAYENDVLHALTETGGMPGTDAENEIIVMRGVFKDGADRDRLISEITAGRQPCQPPPIPPDDPTITYIPLRFFSENVPQFTEEDVILNTGDIVMIRSREQEKFYTGGLLGGAEYAIPRDYDLDILGAIALAGGPIGSGGTGIGQAGGRSGGGRGGNNVGVPASQAYVLRRIEGGGQIPILVNLNRALKDPSQRILIQPEDVVLVRYTLDEELINAALNLVQFNFLFNGLQGGGGF